jgi:hypothetical protein
MLATIANHSLAAVVSPVELVTLTASLNAQQPRVNDDLVNIPNGWGKGKGLTLDSWFEVTFRMQSKDFQPS